MANDGTLEGKVIESQTEENPSGASYLSSSLLYPGLCTPRRSRLVERRALPGLCAVSLCRV